VKANEGKSKVRKAAAWQGGRHADSALRPATPVDLYGRLTAASTDSAGIDQVPQDRLHDRRSGHPRRDRQRIEAGRVRLERRRSPQADANMGSITAEILGCRLHEELAASRTPGSDAPCGSRSCEPSARRSQARRDCGQSPRTLLTPAVSGAPRHSPSRSHSHRHGARSRVPDAVKPAVSPPCLPGTTLSPQPKGPGMPPSRPTPAALSAPCQWTRPAARAARPGSLADRADRSCRLIKLVDIQLKAHDVETAGTIA
jgi:hypothetical protein